MRPFKKWLENSKRSFLTIRRENGGILRFDPDLNCLKLGKFEEKFEEKVGKFPVDINTPGTSPPQKAPIGEMGVGIRRFGSFRYFTFFFFAYFLISRLNFHNSYTDLEEVQVSTRTSNRTIPRKNKKKQKMLNYLRRKNRLKFLDLLEILLRNHRKIRKKSKFRGKSPKNLNSTNLRLKKENCWN